MSFVTRPLAVLAANRSVVCASLLLLAGSATAQETTHSVVPAAFAAADAPAHLWLPGVSRELRQQTLVGASHLQPLLGRELTALEFRRSAAAEAFAAGTARWTVTLSTAAQKPLRAAREFATNVGSDGVLVFDGIVGLPASPAAPGPTVPWSAANTLRVEFVEPFRYRGGTLCVDIVGRAVPGAGSEWWPADAVFEDLQGSAVSRGDGCGLHGGASGAWSHVAARPLVPGGHVTFSAFGAPDALAMAVFGQRLPTPVPLGALGWPDATCALHLGSIDAVFAAVFTPPAAATLAAFGGEAELVLRIPDHPAVFGATMTTQWFDLQQMAASNAVEWQVASVVPSLDMALVDGDADRPSGQVSLHTAHVLRFEHR